MNQLTRNAIFIIVTSLGGLMVSHFFFGTRINGASVLGSLILPLIIVMLKTRRRQQDARSPR